MKTTMSRRAIAAALPLAVLARSPTTWGSVAMPSTDPIFAQIDLHKALLLRANTMPGDDDDPAFQAACSDEEAAIQALGDMQPTSIAAAVAQLRYMAEVEGAFATGGSPLLRTVLSAAEGLASIGGRMA